MHCGGIAYWRADFSRELDTQSIVKDSRVYRNTVEIKCGLTEKRVRIEHFKQLEHSQEASKVILQKMRQAKQLTDQTDNKNARF